MAAKGVLDWETRVRRAGLEYGAGGEDVEVDECENGGGDEVVPRSEAAEGAAGAHVGQNEWGCEA